MYYLNHVGYKVIAFNASSSDDTPYYLNHVGYKASSLYVAISSLAKYYLNHVGYKVFLKHASFLQKQESII